MIRLVNTKLTPINNFVIIISEVMNMAYRDSAPHTTIRLPDELKQKLEAEAKRQDRSLNNLMVKILKDYIQDQERRAGE